MAYLGLFAAIISCTYTIFDIGLILETENGLLIQKHNYFSLVDLINQYLTS